MSGPDSGDSRPLIAVLYGTRPEAIKLFPVLKALEGVDWARTIRIASGQHSDMLDEILNPLGITPDVQIDLHRKSHELSDLFARALVEIASVLQRTRPAALLIQGDTTTAVAGAVAAFHEGIPVAHVEAGLRTGDLSQPFPEEANRRIISTVAAVHFAPTETARANLLKEGVANDRVHVTGNTVVDALHLMQASKAFASAIDARRDATASRTILVTLHRRENWGEPLRESCLGLADVIDRFEDVELLFPMHKNPRIREIVLPVLGHRPRARLVEPVGYLQFLRYLSTCDLVVTDSGGIQEEAPSFGCRAIVLREVTERPEAVDAGYARLCVPRRADVYRTVSEWLTSTPDLRSRPNPFGDGRAAQRIVRALKAVLSPPQADFP